MLLWIIAALAAFFIKGLCGFANTLVFTSVLSFASDNVNITPVELVTGFPSNLILTLRNRKKLQPKIFLPLAALVLLGSIPGAFLLKNTDTGILKIVFGAVVVLAGVEMLVREYHKKEARMRPVLLGVLGFLSGILCGLFGVGALLAAYVSRVTDSSGSFKANISAVFIADNLFRIILYSVLGIITLPVLKQVLILLPFMLIGLFAGMLLAKHLNERLIKKLVILLLIVSGIALILNQLLA